LDEKNQYIINVKEEEINTLILDLIRKNILELSEN
jgi:hypothetical protein